MNDTRQRVQEPSCRTAAAYVTSRGHAALALAQAAAHFRVEQAPELAVCLHKALMVGVNGGMLP